MKGHKQTHKSPSTTMDQGALAFEKWKDTYRQTNTKKLKVPGRERASDIGARKEGKNAQDYCLDWVT